MEIEHELPAATLLGSDRQTLAPGRVVTLEDPYPDFHSVDTDLDIESGIGRCDKAGGDRLDLQCSAPGRIEAQDQLALGPSVQVPQDSGLDHPGPNR